jgi:hypothetical protein
MYLVKTTTTIIVAPLQILKPATPLIIVNGMED